MSGFAGIGPIGDTSGPDEGGRVAVIAVSALLHIALIFLFSLATAGNGMGVTRDARDGQPLTVELLSPDPAAERSRAGGGVADARDLPFTSKQSDVAIRTKGASEAADAGNAEFDTELANLLADDPLAGAGKSVYGAILRKHIAAHSRRRGDRIGRNDAGLV
ncbi:MAG: hypothetical protein ACREB0_05535, partial [Sphingopyxis sp.]